MTRFPPSEVENLPVWRHVLLRALSQDARRRVEAAMVSLAQQATADWQSAGCKLGQVDKVVRTTGCDHLNLDNFCQSALFLKVAVKRTVYLLLIADAERING